MKRIRDKILEVFFSDTWLGKGRHNREQVS